jgi:hypothetical protein
MAVPSPLIYDKQNGFGNHEHQQDDERDLEGIAAEHMHGGIEAVDDPQHKEDHGHVDAQMREHFFKHQSAASSLSVT